MQMSAIVQRRFWCLLAIAGSSIGCNSGTETGNPSFSREFAYAGTSSSANVGVGEAPSDTEVVIERAWLSLDQVSLLRGGSCNPSALPEVEVPALGVGDHAAGNHNFTAFEVSAGRLCSARLPFVNVTEADVTGATPPDLLGHSVLLEGRLGDSTPLRILSAAAPAIAFDLAEDALELSEDDADLLVVFDFATWLSNVDLSAAEASDGIIEVSPRSNPDALATIEANLARGILLYRDRDRDGRIDAGSEPLARGD